MIKLKPIFSNPNLTSVYISTYIVIFSNNNGYNDKLIIKRLMPI